MNNNQRFWSKLINCTKHEFVQLLKTTTYWEESRRHSWATRHPVIRRHLSKWRWCWSSILQLFVSWAINFFQQPFFLLFYNLFSFFFLIHYDSMHPFSKLENLLSLFCAKKFNFSVNERYKYLIFIDMLNDV